MTKIAINGFGRIGGLRSDSFLQTIPLRSRSQRSDRAEDAGASAQI